MWTRKRIVVLAIVVIFTVFAGVMLWKSTDDAVLAVAVGLVVNLLAAFLGVAFGVNKLDEFLRRSAISPQIRSFWNVPAPRKPWIVLSGGRRSADTSDPELRVTSSTVYAFSRVEAILKQIHGVETEVQFGNVVELTSQDALEKCNIVLLGGIEKIPNMRGVLEMVDGGAIQDSLDSAARIVFYDRDLMDRKTELISSDTCGAIVTDYAIVTRFIDRRENLSIFSFAGGLAVGTGGAVVAMTEGDLFNGERFDPAAKINQSIVTVKVERGAIYRGHGDIRCKSWSTFSFDQFSELKKRLVSADIRA